MKWKVIYKCAFVCVCAHVCVFVFVVIELLLGFVLEAGTFTSPVLVLEIGLYFILECYSHRCVYVWVWIWWCGCVHTSDYAR